MVEYKRIQLRRDTSENWHTENPVLFEGEIGVDLTNNNIKIGDGSTAWNDLDYVHSDVDLSNYYTKEETDDVVEGTKDALQSIIDTKVDNDTYQAKIGEIEGEIEGKADRTDIPSLNGYATEAWVEGKGYLTEHQSLDDYYTKEEIDGKQQAIDNSLATKADATETANRFNSVDEYLDTLHTEVEKKADAASIPTKTSELENDSNFLTEHQSLEDYYTKGETDTAIQDTKDALQDEISAKVDNDTYEGKISEIEGVLEVKADRSEIPSLSGYATESWVEGKGYLTEHQDISKLATKEELPTKTSELQNDSGFLTEHQSLSDYYTKEETNTKLANKVEQTEFVERCEAIEQSVPTNTETWTFELEDGSTITKQIYVK